MSVFERLSRQGTISSIQKQRKLVQSHATSSSAHPVQSHANSSSAQAQRHPRGSRGKLDRDTRRDEDEVSSVPAGGEPTEAPNIHGGSYLASTSMRIEYRTRVEKNEGRPSSTLPVSALPEIRRVVREFESETISERQLAIVVIEALFHRDFMPGRYWDVESATVSEISDTTTRSRSRDDDDDGSAKGEEDACAYSVEKEATWDHKDIYSVASAKGIVTISRQSRSIFIDEYSYYVAG
mmetsp:Transcript_5862/g.16491  ORF Transcript_5862/g.16491 Transcript_5862/m.16491 type:complete len:238 (+) Transcript_5862:126-839(+)